MISIEPQVTQNLLRCDTDCNELVSIYRCLIIVIVLTLLCWGPAMCIDDILPILKMLDVYAAFACVEHLEPTDLDTDAQRQFWLRQVKKLQVPIESICSEDNVRQYGGRSKDIVSRVQLVKLIT